jgi:hypothetical protein
MLLPILVIGISAQALGYLPVTDVAADVVALP